MFWAVGHLHGSRCLSSWILTLQSVRESVSWGGGNPTQSASTHALAPSRWARICQSADMKGRWTFFFHLFHFMLERSRRERKGVLCLRHESSFGVRILGKMGKSWPFQQSTWTLPACSSQGSWTMCAQQWNPWHWLLLWPISTQNGTQPMCALSYIKLRYLTQGRHGGSLQKAFSSPLAQGRSYQLMWFRALGMGWAGCSLWLPATLLADYSICWGG